MIERNFLVGLVRGQSRIDVFDLWVMSWPGLTLLALLDGYGLLVYCVQCSRSVQICCLFISRRLQILPYFHLNFPLRAFTSQLLCCCFCILCSVFVFSFYPISHSLHISFYCRLLWIFDLLVWPLLLWFPLDYFSFFRLICTRVLCMYICWLAPKCLGGSNDYFLRKASIVPFSR